MRLFKTITLLAAILLSNVLSAQTAKTVNATVTPKTAYNEGTAEYKKYSLLIDKLTQGEKELNNLSKEEIRLMKKYDTYYPEGFNESEAPWSVLGPGCSWYCGANYDTKVSSFLAAQGSNDYSEKSSGDDDMRTAWIEGVAGYGIGEYIEFIFEYNAPRATSVTISNGYNKNATAWKNNSRVKTLNIYEDDKLLMIVNLTDTRDLQHFDLPHPIPNRKGGDGLSEREDNKPPVRLKMVITEVFKGDKYDDTAISEILFDGMDVHCLMEGTMITMGNMEDQAIEKIKKGQEILVWNPEKKLIEKQKVKEIHLARHPASHIIVLHYEMDKDMVTLSLTSDHPVYSPDGWLSANPSATTNYKQYKDIKIGKLDSHSTLYRLSKDKKGLVTAKISTIENQDNTKESIYNTYTLHLDGNGIFFANGFAVGQE